MLKEANNLNSNSEELIQRIDIKDTPFQIIVTERGAWGIMGKYRLTEILETPEKVEEVLTKLTWNRIIQVMMLLIKDQEWLDNLKTEGE